MNNYFSFLFCFHPNQTDIYYSGMPIGHIREGIFAPHKFKLADGSFRELTIQDLPHPCEFGSIEELKEKLFTTINAISIKSRNE